MNMHVEAERFRKTLESSGDFLEPAEICVSIIQSRWGEEDRWLLDSGEVTGRAFSCLVCPEPGDKVVVLRSGGRPSILSILARPKPGSVAISLGKHTDLDIRVGKFSLLAEDTATIKSMNSVSISAPLGRIQLMACDLFQTVTGTLVSLAKSMVNKTVDYQMKAEGTVVSTAGAQVITAERDLRLDAERINMG